MDKINILNKPGLLTNEDRKETLQHSCDYIEFTTCLDLSEPVKMRLYGTSNKISIQNYSKDIASFICWWTHFVQKDLNGFSGFYNVKFEPIGFEVI
ncbi:MAG: hypothetical protein PHT69_02665 [Bacteroidales bacterium]|nr:hypothetical protein [Bacteroidales bacterium]